MAINTQKLLPPAKLSVGERMAAAYDKKIDDLLNLKIKKKLINVDKVVNTTKKVKEKTKKQKKTRKENEEREKKEGRLEQKQPRETSKLNLPGLPKTGILDTVQNFLGYTFLGYLFTNYSDKLSPLSAVVKKLPAAMDTFGSVIKGTVNISASIIEGGYKFKNDISQKVNELGGKDAQKTFDTFTNNFKDMINSIMTLGLYKPQPVPQKANGGYVRKMAPGGNVTKADRPVGGPISRQVQPVKAKKQPIVFRQKTEPGKDIGGSQKIERIFPKSKNIQKPGPLNSLMTTSSELKKVPLIGSLMSAAVDIAMGQKPDKRVYQSFGQAISHLVGPGIETQSNVSVSNLTSAILKMAKGGPVPLNRQISSSASSTDRLAIEIAKMFQISVENRLSRIFSEILKTSPTSLPGEGVPPAEISEDTRKASDDLIEYFSKLYGKPAAIGIVANLLRESGLRTYAPESGFHGMAQWDDNRWSKLTKWAESNGKDPMNRSTQAEYIAIELNESGTGKRLKNTKTPDEAASIFYNEFERGAYSKPVVGEQSYRPDNPHEQKNRSFIATLAGSSYEYVAPGKIRPVVTSRFGEMRSTGPHGGSDLAVPEGTPLRALSDGNIIESDFDAGGWGYYLVFKDNKGIYHLYGHMQNKSRTGLVKKGDIIGMSGSTGRVTGPHLHWEAGTGYKGGGILTGKFDPLNRYSQNAPFSTSRESTKTKTIKPKDQASGTTSPLSAQVASTKPKIMDAANQVAMLPSYDQPETILILQEKIVLKESGDSNNMGYSMPSNISFPGVNSTIPTLIG